MNFNELFGGQFENFQTVDLSYLDILLRLSLCLILSLSITLLYKFITKNRASSGKLSFTIVFCSLIVAMALMAL